MSGAIFELLVSTFFPAIRVDQDGSPDKAYRLQYGDNVVRWIPGESLYHNYFKPNSPFCVLTTSRRRKDWAHEIACLISLAQMRGGGEVMVLSVRDRKVWMLLANVDTSYLEDLVNSAPKDSKTMPKRFFSKLVITRRGGWDMIEEEGREGFWQELAYHLVRMTAEWTRNEEAGTKLMAAWRGFFIGRPELEF
jgi:hypothetical protein